MAHDLLLNTILPPWLSRKELIELAGVDDAEDHKKARSRIKRWLRRNGIQFLTACNGWPQVSRAKVREALGESVGTPVVSSLEPDYSKVS